MEVEIVDKGWYVKSGAAFVQNWIIMRFQMQNTVSALLKGFQKYYLVHTFRINLYLIKDWENLTYIVEKWVKWEYCRSYNTERVSQTRLTLIL